MRAIDADALIPMMKYATTDSEIGVFPIKIGFNDIKKVIDEQSTIEPQRKKGRWIKKTIKKKIENDYSCSECGRHVSVMRGYDVRMVYPFCHCGADMTEGEG